MTINIIFVIVGLALVVFGADFLVDGASSIARRAGISEFVIGLTIVGFGTSCPELVVSCTGALSGSSDISVGNVAGSNIFNSLLILGLTALIAPLSITKSNVRRDIPICLGTTLLLICLGMKHTLFGIGSDGLTRVEGILFLILFIAYILLCFKTDDRSTSSNDKETPKKLPLAILLTLGGLAALIFGGQLFVDSAQAIAKQAGISDKFIAITLLAGGTSLPELATCIVAAAKKKGQLALGNILGSNVFNILLILGVSAVIHPLSFANINLIDMGVLLLSALLILTAAFTGKKNTIDRLDGILMLILEIAYMIWLTINL